MLEADLGAPRKQRHTARRIYDRLVAERGYDPAYGARPVKRVVNALVADALGQALLEGSVDRARPILADAAGGAISFSQPPAAPAT